MRRSLIALPSLLLVATTGCFTSYRAATLNSDGVGYGETRVKPTVWSVYYQGSPYSDRDWVEAALLYRAAELVLENGFDSFILLDTNTSSRTKSFRFGGGSTSSVTRVGNEVQIHETRQPGSTVNQVAFRARALIQGTRGAVREDDLSAFDARETLRLLKPRIENPQLPAR